jgi:hypothetical protein
MSIITKIFNSKILPLINLINTELNIIQKEKFKYNSALNFKSIFYLICQIVGCSKINYGFDDALADIKTEKLFSTVTKQAVIIKKNLLDFHCFDRVSNVILNYIYKNSKYRLLGVDGTYPYSVEALHSEGIPLSNNENACILPTSVLFDIDKKIIIDYNICSERNEREALYGQFHVFKKGDIVVHDRLYMSYQVLKNYNINNIDAIFRLPISKTNYFKKIKSSKKNDILFDIPYSDNTKITVRLIKYQINIKGIRKYYLLTTLTDPKFTVKFFIDAYKKRWGVETHIRHAKYDMGLANIRSKTLNGVRQEVSCIKFISMLSSYIESLLLPHINSKYRGKYKINTGTCIHLTLKQILKLMFYCKNKDYMKLKIVDIFKIISENIIEIKNDRSYPRRRKKPIGKWSLSGSSSNRPKKKPGPKKKKKDLETLNPKKNKISKTMKPNVKIESSKEAKKNEKIFETMKPNVKIESSKEVKKTRRFSRQ